MKRMIFTILLAAAAMQISTAMPKEKMSVQGQKTEAAQKSDEQRKAEHRKQLHEVTMRIIKNELSLTDEQYKEFIPIYSDYRKAVRGENAGIKSERINIQTANDELVMEKLNLNLERNIHVATVRKEFVPKFSKTLNARQITKLYQLDNTLAKKAHEIMLKRKGDKSAPVPRGTMQQHHGEGPKGPAQSHRGEQMHKK